MQPRMQLFLVEELSRRGARARASGAAGIARVGADEWRHETADATIAKKCRPELVDPDEHQCRDLTSSVEILVDA